MAYWLVKSEAQVYSISDLQRDKRTAWDGVRNCQARNYIKSMQIGDEVLIYHSSDDLKGIAGLAKVAKCAYPDPLQFKQTSEYFDATATKQNPRWYCPDLAFVEKFRQIIPLEALRESTELKEMQLLRRGNRLSVLPLEKREFDTILELARNAS